MKPPQGVLILGWIILCSTIVFLFNEQLQYQFPVQNNIAPKIAKPEYVVSGQGSKKYSRVLTTANVSESTILPTPDISINCKRMNLDLSHPQRSIVASLGNGRLGNQMSNFASCYALMKEYGMYHYLDAEYLKLVEKVFVMPEVVDDDNASYYLWDTKCIEGKSIHWKGMSDEDLRDRREMLEQYTTDSYIKLGPYTVDIQGFFPYINELKSIFKFKEDHLKTAKTIIQSVSNTYKATKRLAMEDEVTMVSIHVRLTDFKNHLKSLWNMEFISNEFLTKAMTYYTNKYKNVLFYAMSDDVEAATHKLLIKENSEFDIVFPGVGDIGSPAIDMALLSLSDHSIISYGTFGMWGALLGNKGETIMSKDFIKTDIGTRVNEAVKKYNITNWTFL